MGLTRRSAKGFTLIEMVVTVTIVSLLATIAFPLLEMTSRRAQEQELRDSLRQIRTAIDKYKQAVEEGRILNDAKGSGYPPDLGVLATGVTDVKSPKKDVKIFFLRRIPRDPMNIDLHQPAAATWGLRSYASSPDSPQTGEDVFDIYSLSQRVGLNGIAYKDW
jgi:general secretion pathway protein G